MSRIKKELKLPLIHIGMPKTATKTLQWRLFSEHSEIYYLGRFDGFYFKGKYKQFNASRDAKVQAIMHEIAYKNIYKPNLKRCDSLLKEVLAPAREQNKVPVWSWESYSTDVLEKRRVRAKNLKRIFGDAKILMTIRHPVKLLGSAYLQQLKRDNVGPRGKRGFGPYYRTIDQWMTENFNGEIYPHIDYAETIRIYIDEFGLENVHVQIFEELIENTTAYFGKVCRLLGINEEEGIRLISKNIDNSRWNQQQLDILRDLSRSPLKSLHFRFSGKQRRRQLLQLDNERRPLNDGVKARGEMSLTWRKLIIDHTRQGNEWLENNLNLPLTHSGYFNP